MRGRPVAGVISRFTACASRIRAQARNRRRRFGGLVAIAAITVLVTACNPGFVSSVAGNGTAGNSGDGGKATDASFEQPGGLAVLPDGSYDVVDQKACVIRHVSASGTISTIAGTGTCGYSGDGGPATAAQINPGFVGPNPANGGIAAAAGQLAVDAAGNVYLSDTGNGRIRRIATDGTITTIAGNGTTNLFTGCSGSAVLSGALAFGPDGTLYVDCPNGVFKLMPNGTLQNVIADIAVSMTVDKLGNIYYANNNGAVVKRTPSGTTTVFADLSSLLSTPPISVQTAVSGLSVGPDGSVYAALGPTDLLVDVVDGPFPLPFNYNEVLRLGQGTATVIAGTNGPDPGTGTQSGYGPQLAITPYGIAATANNGLLISSGHNVYNLQDANTAQPWSGTACDPALVKPGYDLSNRDLSGINFYRCNLTGVNFSNANLSGANLKQTILDDTNLSGTNLSGATLDGAHGVGIIGMPAALPSGWYVTAGVLVPPNRDLSGLNLSGRDLTGADLASVNLDGADLRNTNLTGADLAGATIFNNQLEDTNFTGANLSGAKFGGPVSVAGGPSSVNFTNANLSNLIAPDFVNTAPPVLYEPIFTGANLTGADLHTVYFAPAQAGGHSVNSGGITGTPNLLPTGVRLIDGYLVMSNANLTSANLQGVDFSGGVLNGVDLTGLDFTGANLRDTNFSGVNLSGVNLTGANLTRGNLTSTTLTSATVANTIFTDATATAIVAQTLIGIPANAPHGVQFRTNTTATHGVFIYPGVNLSDANLDGVDLSGIDFKGDNLSHASFQGTNLANTNLTNANLAGAGVSGDLTNANFSDANLTSANLDGSTVTNANFAGATATSVFASGLVGIPANAPPGVEFRTDTTATHGAFLYPGANLYGANLDGVDLSGVDLMGAFLNRTSDRGANLANTNLTNADLSFALLTGATGTPIGADTSTYQNTTCPDATVVYSPATCLGHGFATVQTTGTSISGTVTDGSGQPLGGVTVSWSATATGAPEGSTTTASDGTYTIGTLGSVGGTLYIQFAAPAGCVAQWWNHKATAGTADAVTVTGGQATTGIDATLQPSTTVGCIAGTVTAPGGGPVAGATVTVYNIFGVTEGTTITAADGSYTVYGLARGASKVEFQAPGFPIQYWNNQPDFAHANTITVPGGDTATANTTLTPPSTGGS